MGIIAFSPLTQGVLSGKYSSGINQGTRAGNSKSSVLPSHLTPELIAAIMGLEPIAKQRNQTMSQLALSWVLRRKEVTSALIGIRNIEQLKDCLGAVSNLTISTEEEAAIDKITASVLMDLHPKPSGWLR